MQPRSCSEEVWFERSLLGWLNRVHKLLSLFFFELSQLFLLLDGQLADY
jgi:hypothetical protein